MIQASEFRKLIRDEIRKELNEASSRSDLAKITSIFKTHKKDIEDALYKGSGHRYWKLEVLPEWDNTIGGYNLQATATGVTDRNTVLESTNDIKRAIREVKALPFVSKAMVSRRYNKKMMTVIAIGLK
tara:strand:- start:1091 stop:1474 length:384 start_codon:yes stop_codon:yes gene_type:complete